MLHTTPLSQHFKSKDLWVDVIVLTLFWLAQFFISEKFSLFGVQIFQFLKLCALVGTIEIMGFFLYHIFGQKKGIILQGFIGGFVSSTAVFIKFLNEKKFRELPKDLLGKSLIAAVIAMLLECLFIVTTLSTTLNYKLIWPILIHIIVMSLFLLKKDRTNQPSESEEFFVQIDHPIYWKRVLVLSFSILALIFLMRMLTTVMAFPYMASSFFISIFEVHGALASVVLQFNTDNNNNEVVELLIVILLGNFVSKSLLMLRAKSEISKRQVLAPMVLSILLIVIIFSLFAS